MKSWYAAIEQALLLQKQPECVTGMRQQVLPEGMAALIRLASDEGESRRYLALDLGVSERQLQEAAIDYLTTVCLFPESSNLRTLCLNPGVDFRTAKEHHRLLLKWLHPDRNPGSKLLAERVNQAWTKLKPLLDEPQGIEAQLQNVQVSQHFGMPSSGRFPIFLWSLIGLALLFLAWSLIPDSKIYVGDTGNPELSQENQALDDGQSNSEAQFAQRLRNLESTFKQVLAPVKIPQKPAVKRSERKLYERKPETTVFDGRTPEPKQSAEPAVKPVESEYASPKTIVRKVQASESLITPTTEIRTPKVATVRTKASAQAEVPIQAVPLAVSQRDKAQIIVNTFSQRYQQGNINSFMQLFTADARNNRGGLDSIAEDYSRFFAITSQRKIQFTNIQWMDQPPALRMRAKYVSSVRNKGQLIPKSSSGGIELVFAGERGQLLIQQILLF